MLYNREDLPNYVKTAGKVTILTAFTGLIIFMFAFVFDFGAKELSKVTAAGSATTTLTVLNTPPEFTTNPYEVVGSSTSTPTNSGDDVVWGAIGEDSNGAPYFLLVCSTGNTPVANAAASSGALGTAPPQCSPTSTVQWGVSTSTNSGALAIVSTTTIDSSTASLFNEANLWFAWVCDDDPVNPRCNATGLQGDYATSTSPFNVNSRPVFSDFDHDGPVDPAGTLTFHSTSSDPDTAIDNDIILVVCQTNTSYSTTTNTCADVIATTTISILTDAAATYTLAAIVQDQTYPAYGYVVDQFGHEALGNGISAPFIVNNVAPKVTGGDISLNGGVDLMLTVPGGETPSSTLTFTITDANSCVTAASSSEITGFSVSVFKSSIGTTTCDGTSDSYNPNYCYPSGLPSTTWDLQCTAVSSCADDGTQDDVDYECTFPLWFVADPTSGLSIPASELAQNWRAGVAGIDNDNATGTMATSTGVQLESFPALDVLASEIAYGAIEPGSDSGTLSATSTAVNIGNTGLDQETSGESMCGTFTPSSVCPVSASSTIPADQQQFATSSLAYGSGQSLSSSTPGFELEINIPTTTATSTYAQKNTFWGISVPGVITLAGSYTGLNSYVAAVAEAIDW